MLRSLEWFEQSISGSHRPIVLVGHDGRIARSNRALTSLLIYEPAEILERPVECLFDVEQGAEIGACIRALRDLPIVRSERILARRKDATTVLIEATLSAVTDSADILAVVLFDDISERTSDAQIKQHLSALVESADDAILSKTLDGVLRSCNPAASRLLGYAEDELIGKPVTMLIPDDRQSEEDMIIDRIRLGQRVAHFETKRRRRDGQLVDVSLTISPIRGSRGEIIGASKIMRDISDLVRTREALEAVNVALQAQVSVCKRQIREREVLLQELHHRVKNNLQLISSLINMQARTQSHVGSKETLMQCQGRIAAIAQIHEMLYSSTDYGCIPFADYVRGLVSRIESSAHDAIADVSFSFDLESIELPLDKAIPCGLILHELVSNSLRHGFGSGATGNIRVTLKKADVRRVVLAVADNGSGFSDGALAAGAGLGMRLVHTLARQIGADVNLVQAGGSTFLINFPQE